MEEIINNPGFQHITEKIFLPLKCKDLLAYELTNKSSNDILNNPLFWLKKLISTGLSKKNQEDWIIAFKLTKGTSLQRNIMLYMRKVLKNDVFLDIPCYIKENAVKITLSSPEKLLEVCRMLPDFNGNHHDEIFNLNHGLIQLVAPLMKNPGPNPSHPHPFYCRGSLFNCAAFGGYVEVIKILAPLTRNPNAPNQHGVTPIDCAVQKGHIDIIKFLAPLASNPNAPDFRG